MHRLDVAKLLFHQSSADARVVPFLAETHDNSAGRGDEQAMLDKLQELPAATTKWRSSNVDYFSLLGSRSIESRILCTNKMAGAVFYDSHSNSTVIMPGLSGLGPVPMSVSVARAGAKEEDLYIMHGESDGQELNSNYHFNVLRFGTLYSWSKAECWYWQSLPLPPFVNEPQYKPALISSYTVVGHTICMSSEAEGVGTYCFNTASCAWERIGDWMLPFTGRAEYIPYLKHWLGFSRRSPSYLCAVSGLSDMVMDQQPTLQIIWPHHTPKEVMTVKVYLLNLGPGKFAIAKVLKVVGNPEKPSLFSDQDTVEDEFS